MKKSEIIKFLSEKKCGVMSYYRENNSLCVYLRWLSGYNIKTLDEHGFEIFIEAVERDMLFLEITGYIEWD